MDVAVIGAAGACARQLSMQLLDRRIVPEGARLQLVGHRGGASEHALWGLRADLNDAFADHSPTIDLAFDPSDVHADIVVMLAGATVSTEPGAPVDRASLGRVNAPMFDEYATALAQLPEPPLVIVQSNPVELAVHCFARRLPPHRVWGAAGWSDTLRLRREIAVELGVRRRQVGAFVLGQHGDSIVPIWSLVRVHGVPQADVDAMIARVRRGRSLTDLPLEIADRRAAVLALIRAEKLQEAFELVQSLPVDLRVAVKPFFTAFTSGRSTEAVTARAAADLVAAVVEGVWLTVPAQVATDSVLHTPLPGLRSPMALPVVIGPNGWIGAHAFELADDERDALFAADAAVAASIESALAPDA